MKWVPWQEKNVTYTCSRRYRHCLQNPLDQLLIASQQLSTDLRRMMYARLDTISVSPDEADHSGLGAPGLGPAEMTSRIAL